MQGFKKKISVKKRTILGIPTVRLTINTTVRLTIKANYFWNTNFLTHFLLIVRK